VRTEREILDRIEARKEEDMFGFEWPYYLSGLSFDAAKKYLKPEAVAEGWEIKDADALRQEAIDYMPFAWDKANNCRGISVNRSVMHYQAWLWLLGEDWGDQLMDDYEYYGKPQLVRVCEYLGLDPKQWDDGIRSNTEY
jgi:hypothetical protein